MSFVFKLRTPPQGRLGPISRSSDSFCYGTRHRHRKTRTYGKQPNLNSTPRQELAKDVQDVRKIYQQEELYTPQVRESLQKVIDMNKKAFPDIFKKVK